MDVVDLKLLVLKPSVFGGLVLRSPCSRMSVRILAFFRLQDQDQPVVELGFISSLGKFSSLSVSSVLISLGKKEFAG
jgi:hypothetical protein